MKIELKERENLQKQQLEILDNMKVIRSLILYLEDELQDLEEFNEDLKKRASELGVNLIPY